MASSRVRIENFDENTNSELNGLLKNKAALSDHSNMTTAVNEPQRRVALGGLTNHNIQSKPFGNRTLKQSLKEVKPKVDTHWKRPESTVPLAAVKKITTTATAVVPRSDRALLDVARSQTTSHLVADAAKKINAKTSVTASTTALLRPSFRKAVAPGSLLDPVASSHSSRQLTQHTDIDAQDAENPFLMSEYVCDIYNYLQELEVKYPIQEGFLDMQDEINPRMRSVLIDWINEVHFQFKLLPETYFMAIGLIDRYLQQDANVARKNLQLVGATALFVAAKYEELYPPVLADFVYITDNTYSEYQVIEMEKKILCALRFELCPPVAIHFLRRYSKAAVSEPVTHTLAKYFIELTTIDYQMCHYSASKKSAAALYLSLIMLKIKTSLNELRFTDFWTKRSSSSSSILRSSPQSVQLWTPNLAHYSNYEEAELRPVVRKLAAFVLAAPKAKSCRAIHNKYSLPKFDKCAQLPELSGNLIKTLATEWTAEDTLNAAAAGQ